MGVVLVLVASGLSLPLESRSSVASVTSVPGVSPARLPAPGAATPASPPPISSVGPWTNITAGLTTSPSAREGAAMAYDPSIGEVVLFGGLVGSRTADDTWVFAQGHWTNLTPTLNLSPRARQHAGFVYDSGDAEMLLFGGHVGATYLNDTWTFNGTAWHPVNSTASPSPREDLMMADDPADGYVVLFGGEEASGQLFNDTWTFHGGQWTNETSSISGTSTPTAREDAGFTYDGADHYDLLFSGKAGASGLWNDTWDYSGGVWKNITSKTGPWPPKREAPSLSYDAVDGRVVLFGGLHFPTILNDTWTFVGGNWTEVSPATVPSARFDAPMSFYPNQGLGYAILFGGQSSTAAPAGLLNDTWIFKVPLTVAINLSASKIDLGQSDNLTLEISGGYAPYVGYQWEGLPSACPSVNATALSCTPGASGNYTIAANVTDSGGYNGTSAPAWMLVNPDPSVTAQSNVSAGPANLSVGFNATITGGTAGFAYDWLFGDGGTSTLDAPTYVYKTPGVYFAALTVTDSRQLTASVTLSAINVTAAPAPLTASISASPTSGTYPLTVDFSLSASGGVAPYTYNWSFGVPGATSASADPTYQYNSAGTFTARVVVTDQTGANVTRSVQIQVSSPSSLVAVASAIPTSGVAPLMVTFTGGASGGVSPYTYSWNFDGTAKGTGAAPSFLYTTPGSYSAVLTVTDSFGVQASASVPITAFSKLSTSFIAMVGAPYCDQGVGVALVTLSASASGGNGSDTFAWSFPNGVGTGAIATTTVSAGYSWTIQLTTTDAGRKTATSTQSVLVPSVSCSTAAGNTTSTGNLLILVLIVIVGAVIAIELVLLWRRPKKKD